MSATADPIGSIKLFLQSVAGISTALAGIVVWIFQTLTGFTLAVWEAKIIDMIVTILVFVFIWGKASKIILAAIIIFLAVEVLGLIPGIGLNFLQGS